MDSIDITDSNFSLDIPDKTIFSAVGGDSFINYSNYIYIGILIVVAFIGLYVYKYFYNKKNENNVDNLDCPGGFCNFDTSS